MSATPPPPAGAPPPVRPVGALPFSAVVGQDDAKLALILAAVEPRLGGVLLRGDKGSAKTTLARGLAALLAPGAPFVELPLGASEDRVVGSIDVASLLADRVHAFRPGLLAAAHGGVLYVDEVNLLADHIVDTLLDVAVSGVNRVERDGISERHPARFVLVGSMNPEEGELRPQLLDRFGLVVDVRATTDPSERAEIVARQLAAERGLVAAEGGLVAAGGGVTGPGGAQGAGGGVTGPGGAHGAGGGVTGPGGAHGAGDRELARRLASTRPAVVGGEVIAAAARLAVAVGAEGLRADLSLCRAAAALAGWEGRRDADVDDLRRVAPLVLGHRRRRDPLEAPGIGDDQLNDALDETLGPPPDVDSPGPDDRSEADDSPGPDSPGPEDRSGPDDSSGAEVGGLSGDEASDRSGESEGTGDRPASPPDPPRPADDRSDRSDEVPLPDPAAFRLPPPPPRGGPRPVAAAPPTGARSGTAATARSGRVVRSEPMTDAGGRVAVAASVVAAAVRDPAGDLRPGDLRRVVSEAPRGRLVVVAVDASGSMAGRRRLDLARAAVLGLLGDAYRRRDRVAMVAFSGDRAEVVLRPTGSVEVARTRLGDVATGGTTPLAAGLRAVTDLVRTAAREGTVDPVAVIITDGRATSGGDDPVAASHEAATALAATGARCVVLDAESGPVRLGLARELAAVMGADHVELDGSTGDAERAIRDRLPDRSGAVP